MNDAGHIVARLTALRWPTMLSSDIALRSSPVGLAVEPTPIPLRFCWVWMSLTVAAGVVLGAIFQPASTEITSRA
jgi:hypothetical protein